MAYVDIRQDTMLKALVICLICPLRGDKSTNVQKQSILIAFTCKMLYTARTYSMSLPGGTAGWRMQEALPALYCSISGPDLSWIGVVIAAICSLPSGLCLTCQQPFPLTVVVFNSPGRLSRLNLPRIAQAWKSVLQPACITQMNWK